MLKNNCAKLRRECEQCCAAMRQLAILFLLASGHDAANAQFGFRDYLITPTRPRLVNSAVGIQDDIDNDGVAGVAVFIDDDTNIIGFVTDFDDLHEFKVFFDTETTHALSGSQAVDFAKVSWLDGVGAIGKDVATETFHVSRGAEALLMRDEINTGIEGGAMGPRSIESTYEPDVEPRFTSFTLDENGHSFGLIRGIRVLQTMEHFRHSMRGSIFGRTSSDLLVENNAVAPHVGVVWATTRGPLSVQMQGLLLLGYNTGRVKLYGSMGEDLIPGALNRPLFARSTRFSHVQSYDGLSRSIEIRADGKLQISKATAFRVSWSGVAIDNLIIGTDRLDFRLPSMGLSDRGLEAELVHQVYCGFEVVR
jgi:hypothetical protein